MSCPYMDALTAGHQGCRQMVFLAEVYKRRVDSAVCQPTSQSITVSKFKFEGKQSFNQGIAGFQ